MKKVKVTWLKQAIETKLNQKLQEKSLVTLEETIERLSFTFFSYCKGQATPLRHSSKQSGTIGSQRPCVDQWECKKCFHSEKYNTCKVDVISHLFLELKNNWKFSLVSRQVVLQVYPRTLHRLLQTPGVASRADAVPVASPSAVGEDRMLRGTTNQLPTLSFEGERKRDEWEDGKRGWLRSFVIRHCLPRRHCCHLTHWRHTHCFHGNWWRLSQWAMSYREHTQQ